MAINCDPSSLANAARCFSSCIPVGEMQAVITYLLCQLVTSGGTGSGQITQYFGASPTADGVVPANISSPAISYKFDGTGPTYTWNTTTHVWQ